MVVHEAEEGGYWAEFPELEGCFTQAETLDALRANAKEAVTGHLAAMAELGQSPKKTGVQVENIEIDAA